jgi:GntR family transcriptional regulator
VDARELDLQPLVARRSSLPSEIASALAARIRSGQIPSGTRLPSEPELARSLGVSRNTVREAIGVLREQGLAASRQGIGTFALDPSGDSHFPVDVGIEQLTSTTEMIARAGHKPGTRDYHLVTGPGDAEARRQLGLRAQEQVHTMERVRTADDLPVILCRDVVSAEVVPSRVAMQYRGDESLFSFIERECHLQVHTARADIVPALPSARVAELLAVSRRKPLLILKQLHYDREGVPFLYSENFFNLEYMGLHVRRTPVA